MALDHTALYLETDGTDRVEDLLGPVFAQQREGRRGTASLRLAAFPGWVAVLGAEALDGRAIIAEGLSRELGGLAVAVELTGAAFRWSCPAFRAGQELPLAGFRALPVARGESMPCYPDAEVEAYQALLRLGVPSAAALLTPESLGEPAETRTAVELEVAEGKLSRRGVELRMAARPLTDPPVAAGAAAGTTRWLEPRAVSGEPNPEALRQLRELEVAYTQRALRAAAPSPGGGGGAGTRAFQFIYRWSDGEELDLPEALARLDTPSLLTRLLKGRR